MMKARTARADREAGAVVDEELKASEWSQEAGLDWSALSGERHAGTQRLVGDLNAAYRDNPALWSGDFTADGFSWIDANDSVGNVVSFLRLAADGSGRVLACVANFAGHPHLNYRIGLPLTGRWREVVNTDAQVYGGSGVGNLGAVQAVAEPWHGRPASARITVPPLGVLWLAPENLPVPGPAIGDDEGEDGAG